MDGVGVYAFVYEGLFVAAFFDLLEDGVYFAVCHAKFFFVGLAGI